MSASPKYYECTNCGCQAELDRWDGPYESPVDDSLVCHECFAEYYDDCAICEEHFLKPEYSNEPEFFIIGRSSIAERDIDSSKLRPGIYQIVTHPFYANGIIEMYLYYDAFRRIGSLFPQGEADFEGFPMSQICPKCAHKRSYFGPGKPEFFRIALDAVFRGWDDFKFGRGRVFLRELAGVEVPV